MVKSEGIHHWFLEEHMYINQIKRVDKKSPLKFVCSLTPKMIVSNICEFILLYYYYSLKYFIIILYFLCTFIKRIFN